MRSCFYVAERMEREQEIPVTFLLIEVLEAAQAAISNLPTYAAIQLAAEQAGLSTPETPLTEEQATSLVIRLNPPKKEEDEQPSPGKGKRSYGTEFLRKFGKLSTEGKCLFTADYNFEEARKLYCVYDKSVTEKIISDKLELVFSLKQMEYEAVVLGMGGSFSGGSAEDIDSSEGLEQGTQGYVDAAMAFQNMQHQFRGKG